MCFGKLFARRETKLDIICDTNIWYDIAQGRIEDTTLDKYRLHPTYINLIELTHTPNLIKDLPLVKATVCSLYKYNGGIYETHPIEFIILKQFPNYERKDLSYNTILKSFERLMEIDVTAKVEESVWNDMKKAIDTYKDILQKSADGVNELLPGIRARIKETTGKKAHRKEESLPVFFDVINFFVKEYTQGAITLDITTYPWEELELFIRVWNRFFKELEVSANQKFQPNDWSDLFSMVYAGKGKKYSTSEIKWINYIKADKHTSPYLISLS